MVCHTPFTKFCRFAMVALPIVAIIATNAEADRWEAAKYLQTIPVVISALNDPPALDGLADRIPKKQRRPALLSCCPNPTARPFS